MLVVVANAIAQPWPALSALMEGILDLTFLLVRREERESLNAGARMKRGSES